ncbi:hypothetical protein Y1Q_0021292 [Alligator mississippiensis]|uniref:Uncharacterized protein n=1 Tax=Alligator mississippiensis TaxID=8496 RepID=A0A151PA18_ALLMI|nr:hypothetical protein Y1Q_0021292 [Alligator mississippiensis]
MSNFKLRIKTQMAHWMRQQEKTFLQTPSVKCVELCCNLSPKGFHTMWAKSMLRKFDFISKSTVSKMRGKRLENRRRQIISTFRWMKVE